MTMNSSLADRRTEECLVLTALNLPEYAAWLVRIWSTLIFLLASTGNGVVFVAIFITPGLRNPSTYILAALAASDFAISFILQPLMIAQTVVNGDAFLCRFSYAIIYTSIVLCGASSWTLALISYDRYLHLSQLFEYDNRMKASRVVSLIACCYIHPVLLGLFLFCDDLLDYYYPIIVGHSFVVFMAILVCYILSWREVRTARVWPADKGHRQRVLLQRHWKFAQTIAIIVGCYCISWTPLTVFLCYLSYDRSNIVMSSRSYVIALYHFALMFGFFNSAINPVLYYWRSREIRMAVRRFVRRMIRRPSRSSITVRPIIRTITQAAANPAKIIDPSTSSNPVPVRTTDLS